MKNIVAIKTNCYKGHDLDTTIKGIKNAGFKYIEIVASPGNSSGISRFTSFNELCTIKDKFINNGLIPLSLGGHTNIMDLDLTSDLIHNIELSKFFGCKYFVCSVGECTSQDDDAVINRLNYFLPYLEKYDINLVIELHYNHCTAKKLNDIVRSINNDRIKINYDTANTIFFDNFENEQIIQDIEEHIDLINYFHLKDKLGNKNEWNFPALGKGYVPFKDIFKILDKYNNNAVLTAEIEFTANGPKDLNEINQAVIDSANYLKDSGFIL